MVASQEGLPHHWVSHRQDLRTKNGRGGRDGPTTPPSDASTAREPAPVEGSPPWRTVLEGRLTGTIGKEVHGEKSG